jgi:hypothetical protein
MVGIDLESKTNHGIDFARLDSEMVCFPGKGVGVGMFVVWIVGIDVGNSVDNGIGYPQATKKNIVSKIIFLIFYSNQFNWL